MRPEERLRALRDADRWSGDAAQPSGPGPRGDRGRGAVVTAVVVVAIAVAIVGLPRLPHGAAPASPSPSASATPTVASPADAVVPWDASLRSSYRLYSAREAAAVPGCTAPYLRVWAEHDGGGALGTFYQGVFVRNTGPLCSLRTARIRLDVGGIATAALSIGGNGSELLPDGASERLQASHVEDCNGGEQAYRTLPDEQLALLIGRVTVPLDATMPFAEPCDLGFSTWDLAQPAGTDEPEPGFSSALRVSVPSLTDGYRGGAFDYIVTLRNVGARPRTLTRGTVFHQIVFNGSVTSLTTATLNVGRGLSLAPGGVVRLRMRVPAPGNAAGGTYWIGWYLEDGTGGAAAQI